MILVTKKFKELKLIYLFDPLVGLV